MLNGIKLLLVEDDEDDYILTRDLLAEIRPAKIQLDWVTSVAQAIEMLQTNDHDLCLVDYQLGKEDGLQLLNNARTTGILTPIIMLTGHPDSDLEIEAQQAGAVDYLVKAELSSTTLGRSIRYARARRTAEEERLQRLQAESENRSKSQFLTHLSHELRTPLTSILGYTQLLLSKEREATKLKDLRTIERNGHHLLNLLNDVLNLSRIEAGKLELDHKAVNLEACLADLQSQLEVRAREKNIQLRISATDHLPETIYTDPTRLQQILLNLLGNAIKFTEEGSVELRVNLTSDDSCIDFNIIDTGIGIDTAAQNTIFEPFSQAGHSSARNRDAGFGLGLAISHELAHALGGSISCESKLGAGSKFTLSVATGDISSIPRKALNLTSCNDLPPAQVTPNLSGRILVVDDLADIRRLIGSILEAAGAEVVFAKNGQQAVDQVQSSETSNEKIDAVVMDLQMPELDGFSALRTLRGKGFELPVIALTASNMKGERERCLQAGFTDYLSKPVHVGTLLKTLLKHTAQLDNAKNPARASQDGSSKRTVLLVEDDDDARNATTKLINHLGWQVVSARNATDALAQVSLLHSEQAAGTEHSSALVDIALIDLGLPDIDGFQLAEKLRSGPLCSSRIIALSGTQAEPGRIKEAGFDDLILKPIGLQKLAELLQAGSENT
tara:strand:+ start:207926 stop:209935 length:2010 start_codon:yes stop_codon:yes gene_type:complete